MTKRATKRMDQIDAAIATLPIRARIVNKGLEHFRETGELPHETRLADAVARKSLGLDQEHAGADSDLARMLAKAHMRLRGITNPKSPEASRPTAREMLLDEAVHGCDYLRRVARTALKREVDLGADPTDHSFLADHETPRYGSIGLSLFGYPDRLARPPYEEQAHRLFARYSAILDECRDDPVWLDEMANALLDLELDGCLPRDQELRENLLCHVELEALVANDRGHNVRNLLLALDRAATTSGDEQDAAFADVCRLGPTLSATR